MLNTITPTRREVNWNSMADEVPTETPDVDSIPGTYGPEQTHHYPTCGSIMQRAGRHSWTCPNQADIGNGISDRQRAAARIVAGQRAGGSPF